MKMPTRVLAVLAPLALAASWCNAAALSVTVLDRDGKPVADVAVVATAEGGSSPGAVSADAPTTAIMDQIDRQFVPGILTVAKGTTVSFPNSDDTAHQVYSFSAPKRFELPLYRGQASKPVTFDQPGIVILGCNIHDSMIGYVYVADSHHHGKTDARGRIDFADLPPGSYRLTAWHPRFSEASPELVQQLTVGAADATVEFRLQRPMKPATEPAKTKKLRY